MVDPFGEISFLTRSENRVTVLTTLADEPHTEREPVEATGISDVTVGRVLEDFADRGWIEVGDEGYRATREGRLLPADYRPLEESMDLVCRIGPVREHLPIEEMDFELRHLVDALVSDPETFDPLRAVDRWKQLIRQSEYVVDDRTRDPRRSPRTASTVPPAREGVFVEEWTMRGAHSGPLDGFPPTGETFALGGTSIITIEEGRLDQGGLRPGIAP